MPMWLGAYDMSEPERTARTRARKKARKAQQRRAKGVPTKEDTAKISALKPWLFEGIDRRTWERNGQTCTLWEN
jgi:hypothetical protein